MERGETFGGWLKRRRGVRGEPGFVSQQELADRVGVLRTYVNQIENGRIGIPALPLRQRIHGVLGTTEDDLIAAGILAPPGDRSATTRARSPLSLVTPSPLARALDAIWQNMTDEQRAYAWNAIDAARSMPPARLGTVAADDRKRRVP